MTKVADMNDALVSVEDRGHVQLWVNSLRNQRLRILKLESRTKRRFVDEIPDQNSLLVYVRIQRER
jgi:hypothetical protein